MSDETIIHQCSHIGVSGTTPVHVRKDGGGYIARVGIALFGATNMDEEGFKDCDHNPFHEQFYDNYAEGRGNTEAEAIDAMRADMKDLANSLWEIR